MQLHFECGNHSFLLGVATWLGADPSPADSWSDPSTSAVTEPGPAVEVDPPATVQTRQDTGVSVAQESGFES